MRHKLGSIAPGTFFRSAASTSSSLLPVRWTRASVKLPTLVWQGWLWVLSIVVVGATLCDKIQFPAWLPISVWICTGETAENSTSTRVAP